MWCVRVSSCGPGPSDPPQPHRLPSLLRSGFIDLTEFFVAIRGDLNERRQRVVQMAFDILDRLAEPFRSRLPSFFSHARLLAACLLACLAATGRAW